MGIGLVVGPTLVVSLTDVHISNKFKKYKLQEITLTDIDKVYF